MFLAGFEPRMILCHTSLQLLLPHKFLKLNAEWGSNKKKKKRISSYDMDWKGKNCKKYFVLLVSFLPQLAFLAVYPFTCTVNGSSYIL